VERSLSPATIPEIVESWERLDATEEEMKAILKQRQAAINTDRGGMSSHSLQEYLYQSQRWTYPALLDGLKMARRVDEARDQVVQSLYSW
jgi:tRNA 2-selenouridine synthase SelU